MTTPANRSTARRGLAMLLAGVAVAGLVGACRQGVDAPRSLPWQRLAAPPGAQGFGLGSGAPLLVTGQVAAAGGAGPALWSVSPSGRWTAVPLHPTSYYGARAELVRASAHGGHVVALGRAIGGTHGNPRFTTWAGTTTSGLLETVQPFELFGGPDAIGISDLASGPATDVIVGAWARSAWPAGGSPAGVTTWTRAGTTWDRHDSVPGLRSTPSDLTTGSAVAADGATFLIAGSVTRLHAGQVSTSATVFEQDADGGWRAVPLPADGESEALDVACSAGVCLVAGVEAGQLALWRISTDTAPVRLRTPQTVRARSGQGAVQVASAGGSGWVLAAPGSGQGVLWRVRGTDVQPFEAPSAGCTALAGVLSSLYAVCGDALFSASFSAAPG